MLVIKGAGDIASGVALRLYRAGYRFVMTDLEKPTAIRRTVSFCEAIVAGETEIEGVRGVRCGGFSEASAIIEGGAIPVLADPEALCIRELRPEAVIDAILAKRNLGTAIDDARAVIALGPGFTAGVDCNAVIETMRGHTLGRVILSGAALPNTGEPGAIGGYTSERVLRTPSAGVFCAKRNIGDAVETGEIVALVGSEPVRAKIGGVLRGLLASDTEVFEGMKCGDVDPRCNVENCFTASDKALAVAGGVLEALLHFDILPRR